MIPEPLPIGAQPPVVDDDAAVDLLHRMVSIRSHSREEAALAEFLVSRLRAMGMRAGVDEAGNAIGSIGPEDAPRTIVLLGHMDTVPGDIPVRREGDLLHGRGTVDAKGPLAAFIVGAANARLAPGVRVDVIGAVEEECATSRGARQVARRPAPDACIIGEPSAWDGVTLGYKGRLLAEYRVRRAAAHSAGPLPTAADSVFEWWASVRRWVDASNAEGARVFDRVQATIRSVNTSGDGLEEAADLVAGFRLPPGLHPGEIEAACRAAATDGELTVRGAEVAYVADRSNVVVRALGAAIRAQRGRPTHRVKTGTSDMNVVGPAWNCPIAAYGPGDSALDHTPGEHMALSEYLAGTRVLSLALERLSAELAGEPLPP